MVCEHLRRGSDTGTSVSRFRIGERRLRAKILNWEGKLSAWIYLLLRSHRQSHNSRFSTDGVCPDEISPRDLNSMSLYQLGVRHPFRIRDDFSPLMGEIWVRRNRAADSVLRVQKCSAKMYIPDLPSENGIQIAMKKSAFLTHHRYAHKSTGSQNLRK
jgi:hypothetical protein